MVRVHRLDGCAPAPLAHYLKALGVLRLVAEQADQDVRGWWEGEHFRIATALAEEEVQGFFLNDYAPTPMFNPWGARSGYFDGGAEKSARLSLKKIACSTVPRLEPYRQTIEVVRRAVSNVTGGKKPSSQHKDELILALRNAARGASSAWMDTVVALIAAREQDDAESRVAQPPVFGTGGSEGSGGYPSAYMSAVVEAVLKGDWNHAVHPTLFGGSEPRCKWKQSMLQFLPGDTSTPWDMLLAFEGACVLRSSVAGRTSDSHQWVSSPFYVAPRSVGYASGSRLDEKFLDRRKEQPGRGEQWLPMWRRPSSFSDVQQLFLQGRATTKRARATDGWAMARSVAGIGVSRGVTEFIRYGYQQRNNQAAHFAVPLGRFRVPERRSIASSCLDDLDRWLSSLHREAHPTDDEKSRRTPVRLTIACRHLEENLFSVVQMPSTATARHWQGILVRLVEVEAVVRRGSGSTIQPLPSLHPDWVSAADDNTSELRLALAFALQFSAYRVEGRCVEDHIRRHWLPLERRVRQAPLDPERRLRFATTGTGSARRLDMSSEVVMHGRRGVDDAIALVQRRLVEASQRGERHLPLSAAPNAAAGEVDIASLLAGGVNLDRTLALGRAFMALDREWWTERRVHVERPHRTSDRPDDGWLAIRLCLLPWPLEMRDGFKLDIGADPALVRRLAAGDARSAVAIALRRLGAAGVRCTVRAATTSAETAKLWAAALAFPITKGTARRFLYQLAPNLDHNKE